MKLKNKIKRFLGRKHKDIKEYQKISEYIRLREQLGKKP